MPKQYARVKPTPTIWISSESSEARTQNRAGVDSWKESKMASVRLELEMIQGIIDAELKRRENFDRTLSAAIQKANRDDEEWFTRSH